MMKLANGGKLLLSRHERSRVRMYMAQPMHSLYSEERGIPPSAMPI
jgi:hypothetical protein